MTATRLAPARQRLVKLMQDTAADQAAHHLWTYLAVRPQHIPSSWQRGDRVVTDCSDGCRMLCRWANLDDPAGNGYAPFGNSSSIWAHLPHHPLEECEPGDIFTFGYYAGEKHACMALEGGGNPTVWNMGGPGQPVLGSLAGEMAGHRGMTVTLCKLPIKPPPPTSADRLRAETGFYPWLAWALGEGRWRSYGKANPNVRPDVPKVIPLAWWRHRAAFLLNRKRGNAAS